MNKNDKDSHLDAFGKLFSNELSKKEMVSIERSPTSANPENNQGGSFLQASEVKQLPGDDSKHECADVDLSPATLVSEINQTDPAIERVMRQVLAQEDTTPKKQVLNGGEVILSS